uniref:Uncharacterized protein n=1 Tax=Lepeophtheirus salmonis TaxID=72036 RepID=A0A0K2UUX9_LEPSM
MAIYETLRVRSTFLLAILSIMEATRRATIAELA